MSLQTQIDTIKQEVGKSRKDKGAKVRLAAIRFEEHFRDKIFSTTECNEWVQAEPELNRYQSNPAMARAALQQAGTRTDLPRSFEIVRIGKSSWALHPPENYFLRGDFPKALVGFFQKTNRKIRQLLQACDWDNQDQFRRLAIINQYLYYKTCQDQARVAISGMQLSLDNMNAEFLGSSPEPALLPEANTD